MTAPVQPGEILAGKYKVERVLGTGGMGVVVAALHIELDERVAIKFLLEEALSNEEAVERFAREARAAVKIKSEHVARVIDVGKLENGAPYMVMEYLEGQDLAAVLEVKHMLSPEEAVEYVLQACEAIAEAHALGIVHRDLKPANLFLASRADGTRAIKVLDFGISKNTGRTSRPEMTLTKTTSVMGSPFYMSPEQMRASKNADTRSDIWALGIILQELISGKAVFDGATMPELCAKILTEDPEPLTQARPGAPLGIEEAVRRCLDKDQEQRFQSIGDLASALAPFGPPRAASSVERIHRVLEKAGIPVGDAAKPAGSTSAETKVSEGEKAAGHDGAASGPRRRPAELSEASRAALAGAATMNNWNTGKVPAVKPTSARTMILGIALALLTGGAVGVMALRGGSADTTPRAPAGQGDRREPEAPTTAAAPTAPGPALGAGATAAASAAATSASAEPVVASVTASPASAVPTATAAPEESAKPVAVKPTPLNLVPRPVAPKPTSNPKADLFSEPK